MKSYRYYQINRLLPFLRYWGAMGVLMLLLISPASANGVWDGGGDGVSWEDPANWEQDRLPGPSDDVCIPVGAGVNLNGSREMVRSIYVSSEAVLAVGMTSSLTVMESLAEGVVVEGELLNDGTLFVNYIPGVGIWIKEGGKVKNHGSLVIDDVKGAGMTLLANARIENHTSGSIDVSRTRAAGILLAAAGAGFVNSGLVSVQFTGNEGLSIGKGATFSNFSSGELSIGNTGGDPIRNRGIFEEKGLLELEGGMGPQQGMAPERLPEPASQQADSIPLSAPAIASYATLSHGGGHPGPPEVPTLGEWGLIMLALGLLCAATLHIGRARNAFISPDLAIYYGVVLNLRLYGQMLVLVLLIVLTGLGCERVFTGTLSSDNITGSLLTAPFAAYLLHLLKASS